MLVCCQVVFNCLNFNALHLTAYFFWACHSCFCCQVEKKLKNTLHLKILLYICLCNYANK